MLDHVSMEGTKEFIMLINSSSRLILCDITSSIDAISFRSLIDGVQFLSLSQLDITYKRLLYLYTP